MTGLLLEPLSLADVDEIVAVINAAYDDWRRLPRVDAYIPQDPMPLTREGFLRAVDHGDVSPECSAVVRHGRRIVAVGTVGFNGGTQRARLGWVAVLPEFRRRGIARRLVEHAMEQARSRGYGEIVTARWVDSRYQPAIALLESCGFAWANPQRCNITMELDIAGYQPREVIVPPGFTIRTWRDGDEPAWIRVKRAAFEDDTPDGWWSRTFGARHDFDPRGWHLCEHNGEVVGAAAAVLTRDPDTGDVMGCCIEWVGVLPEYRGKGLGRALVTACLNYAKPFQPRPMVLVTQPYRKTAVAIYESLGFRTVREWREYSAPLK